MTWHLGIETDHANGRKREAFEVSCDTSGCFITTVVGAHGGSVEKVQRLLMRRGWSWTNVSDGGRDLCPAHARTVGL